MYIRRPQTFLDTPISDTTLIYRAALKEPSQVVYNWVKKLRFVYLLQAGERNFSAQIHTTWEEPFSAALYTADRT